MMTYVDLDEHEKLVDAVRESVRRRVFGLIGAQADYSSHVLECPRCSDRIILLDRPATFALDRGERICKACLAERDLTRMNYPETEIGGEGA